VQSFASQRTLATLTVVHRCIHFDVRLSRLFLRLPTTSFSAGRLRTVGGAVRHRLRLSQLAPSERRVRGVALTGVRASRISEFPRIALHRPRAPPPSRISREERRRRRKKERQREKGTRCVPFDERSLRVRSALSRDREIGKSTTRDDARYHTARTLSARTCRGTPPIALSLCAQDDCRTPLPAYRPKVASSYHREAFVGRSPVI